MKAWEGKHVIIMGLARQGLALIRCLARYGAHIVVTDLKSRKQLSEELAEIEDLIEGLYLGVHPASMLDGTDAIFLSGGVPADLPFIQEARKREIRVLNDSQLFLEQVSVPVIGITGSAGKSTTTSLTGHILRQFVREKGYRVHVGGNIGNPLIASLEEIKPGDQVVMELSSFQLEIMARSPQTAALLNISPNHLDRHKTMENYLAAKAQIFAFQELEDWALIGCDDELVRTVKQEITSRLLGFGRSIGDLDGVSFDDKAFFQHWQGKISTICEVGETPLRGEHNLWNAAAAFALCSTREVPVEVMRSALHSFHGLSHRLEEVARIHGVLWVNDSIATTPERASAALRSFTEPLVILAGGRDKGLPWTPFAAAANIQTKEVILFGEAAEIIGNALHEAGCRCKVHIVENLEEAVLTAASSAKPDSVVLLSPGCTSFDAFKDFEERGERFKELVAGL